MERKKTNVVPERDRDDKQTLKSYRPISLLVICGKIFEQLIYKEMYEFFDESNWLSSSQSLFKPGDTCIDQLISITHDIYKSFNEGYKVRGSLS